MPTVTPTIREDAEAIVDRLGDRLDAISGCSFLVTGAGGFLCSYVADAVAAWNDRGRGAPCRLVAADNFSSGLPERLTHLEGREDVEIRRADLSRPFTLDPVPDWIIHGASIASPPVYRRFPLETIDVNVGGTRQLLELARRGARSMVFLSTSEVYGDPDPAAVPTAEDYRGLVSCTGPRACYDESKRLGETLCSVYARQLGTPVKAVRPFNVYGPGQRLDDGRIVPDLMGAALRREPFALFSDGTATRAFCYVADAVAGMLEVLLAGQDGEPYNLGNDTTEVSIRTLAETFVEVAAEVLGPPAPLVTFQQSADPEYLTDNPQRRCPNLDKIRGHTRYRPQVGLRDGLARALRSYTEQEART